MPIYAYRCSDCGHAKDVLQKMSDAKLTTCPQCGQESFNKQITAAGFQLKGDGWYVTDFRGGANTASTEGASTSVGGETAVSTPPETNETKTATTSSNSACATGCACH